MFCLVLDIVVSVAFLFEKHFLAVVFACLCYITLTFLSLDYYGGHGVSLTVLFYSGWSVLLFCSVFRDFTVIRLRFSLC